MQSKSTGRDLAPTTVSGQLPGAVRFWGRLGRANPWGSFRRRGPLHLAQFLSLQSEPQRKPDIPHPLTRDLPEFLTALGVGTPAIRVVFEILLGEDGFKRSSSMIQVHHILNQETLDLKCGDEELIDPFPTRLPTFTVQTGAGATKRVTITRAEGSSSPNTSQPPSNSSMTSPVFFLRTLAVGG